MALIPMLAEVGTATAIGTAAMAGAEVAGTAAAGALAATAGAVAGNAVASAGACAITTAAASGAAGAVVAGSGAAAATATATTTASMLGGVALLSNPLGWTVLAVGAATLATGGAAANEIEEIQISAKSFEPAGLEFDI